MYRSIHSIVGCMNYMHGGVKVLMLMSFCEKWRCIGRENSEQLGKCIEEVINVSVWRNKEVHIYNIEV